MSSFTTPCDMRMLDTFCYELLSDFEYHIGEYPSSNIIKVPKGFITDFATIPRILWNILPPVGSYAKAAIIHDYLYYKKLFDRKLCDDIFLEGMKVLKVPSITRKIIYYAVRIFGRIYYKKY